MPRPVTAGRSSSRRTAATGPSPGRSGRSAATAVADDPQVGQSGRPGTVLGGRPRRRPRRRRCRRSCRRSPCRPARRTGRSRPSRAASSPARGRSSREMPCTATISGVVHTGLAERRRSARATGRRTRPGAPGRCRASGRGCRRPRPSRDRETRAGRTVRGCSATGSPRRLRRPVPPRRGAGGLGTAGQHQTGVARPHPRRGLQDGVQPGSALPVDRDPRHAISQTGGQGGDPGDVAARAEAVADDDVVHR